MELDINSIYARAEENRIKRMEEQKILREKQRAKEEKEQAESEAFMQRFADSVVADNKAKALAKIEKEKAKAAKEIEDKINKQMNVTDPNSAENQAYKSLLKGFKK